MNLSWHQFINIFWDICQVYSILILWPGSFLCRKITWGINRSLRSLKSEWKVLDTCCSHLIALSCENLYSRTLLGSNFCLLWVVFSIFLFLTALFDENILSLNMLKTFLLQPICLCMLTLHMSLLVPYVLIYSLALRG